MDIQVQWGDQDALGHVNNVMFIRYFESARIHMMIGSSLWQQYEQSGFTAVLAKIECNFMRSVFYPDTLIAQCGLISIGNSSLVVEHQLISKASGNLVANGQGVMVFVDPKAQKSVRIPDDLRILTTNTLL